MQRYFCKFCNKKFQNTSKKKINIDSIRREYSEGKQTQDQIAHKRGRSRKWVCNTLKFEQILSGKNKDITPQETVLIIDTTFYKQFGVMLFRSWDLKRNLLYKIVHSERNADYKEGVEELISDGWKITAIVSDGRPGLRKLLPSIPFQLCQFHKFQRITQLISRNPRLEAGRDLRRILFCLKQTDRESMTFFLKRWYECWGDFLKEKTLNIITGKYHFTHRKLRSAFFSIRRDLDVLFTFQDHYKVLNIPQTSNSIEGYFSHLNSKLNIHRGASRSTQINLIFQLIFV